MKPRAATVDDLDRLALLCRSFHAYSPWSERVAFDDGSARQTLKTMIESPDAAIFIDENGVCGGVIFPLMFNHAHRIAQELFWWSEGHGQAVREAFEAWARNRQVSGIQMSCLADHREMATRRLFRKAGYDPTETALYKEVA